jgi:hypothetical protein
MTALGRRLARLEAKCRPAFDWRAWCDYHDANLAEVKTKLQALLDGTPMPIQARPIAPPSGIDPYRGYVKGAKTRLLEKLCTGEEE